MAFHSGSRHKLAVSGTILVLGLLLLGLSAVIFSTAAMRPHVFAARVTSGVWFDVRLGSWQHGPFGLQSEIDRSLIVPLLDSSASVQDQLVVKTSVSNLFKRTIAAKVSAQKDQQSEIDGHLLDITNPVKANLVCLC